MRTSSILQPDDLEIGRCVTVLKGQTTTICDRDGGNIRTKEDNSLKGVVLEIVAIDLPYLLVDRYYEPGSRSHRIEIDVRELVFKALSQDYVDAYQCKKSPHIKKFTSKAPEA